MSRPILITGGAGSVGRQLVEKFTLTGQCVRIFDLPQMDFSGLEEDPRIEIIKGDATKPHDVKKAIRDVSSIIHLAAILPPNSERSRDITFRVNVGGTENIISGFCALRIGIDRFARRLRAWDLRRLHD